MAERHRGAHLTAALFLECFKVGRETEAVEAVETVESVGKQLGGREGGVSEGEGDSGGGEESLGWWWRWWGWGWGVDWEEKALCWWVSW